MKNHDNKMKTFAQHHNKHVNIKFVMSAYLLSKLISMNILYIKIWLGKLMENNNRLI